MKGMEANKLISFYVHNFIFKIRSQIHKKCIQGTKLPLNFSKNTYSNAKHSFCISKLQSKMSNYDLCSVEVIYGQYIRTFHFGGHAGRHISFLGSPSFMPIYASSFAYYRLCRTFWCIIRFVIPGVRIPIFFCLDCHSTTTVCNLML